jgi:GntR family transcriptional repressor for pyruvate dehydrogenase complex
MLSYIIHLPSGRYPIFAQIGTREPLSKKVAADIEDAIRSKRLVSGAKLPTEHQLCAQFGVSRTVVREAVRMLSARGLASIVKGKGIFVRPFTAETVTDPLRLYLQLTSTRDYVLDVVHARQLIEPVIAAEAALRRSGDDIARLKGDIQQLRECEESSPRLAHLDMAFHLDIARASQNLIMPLLLDPIHRLMPEIKSSVYATVREAKASAVFWHEKVFAMIFEQDAEGARQAMIEHLKVAEDHAQRMLRAQRAV